MTAEDRARLTLQACKNSMGAGVCFTCLRAAIMAAELATTERWLRRSKEARWDSLIIAEMEEEVRHAR